MHNLNLSIEAAPEGEAPSGEEAVAAPEGGMIIANIFFV